jgi:hypothetical protein
MHSAERKGGIKVSGYGICVKGIKDQKNSLLLNPGT